MRKRRRSSINQGSELVLWDHGLRWRRRVVTIVMVVCSTPGDDAGGRGRLGS